MTPPGDEQGLFVFKQNKREVDGVRGLLGIGRKIHIDAHTYRD